MASVQKGVMMVVEDVVMPVLVAYSSLLICIQMRERERDRGKKEQINREKK